jgi:type IV pilus assembly protein PilV
MSNKSLVFVGNVSPKTQTGASLIEVLVAVVLLTFGILGVAGLQLVGTKTNHGSYLRSQAVSLAYDVADRMRANAAGAVANNYNTAAATLYAAADGPACGAVLGAIGAAVDVNQWKSCLEAQLPEGRGIVTPLVDGVDYVDRCGITHAGHNVAGRRLFVIEVNWNNARIANEANADGSEIECVVVRTDVSI